MKKVVLLLMMTVSLLSFAEVKPSGAIVPYECGSNSLEASSVARICFGTVASQRALYVTMVGQRRDSEKKVYVVVDREDRMGGSTYIIQEIETTEERGYKIPNGDFVSDVQIELNRSFGSPGQSTVISSDPEIEAVLRPVFTTMSKQSALVLQR